MRNAEELSDILVGLFDAGDDGAIVFENFVLILDEHLMPIICASSPPFTFTHIKHNVLDISANHSGRAARRSSHLMKLMYLMRVLNQLLQMQTSTCNATMNAATQSTQKRGLQPVGLGEPRMMYSLQSAFALVETQPPRIDFEIDPKQSGRRLNELSGKMRLG
jgi:hypothetical protein